MEVSFSDNIFAQQTIRFINTTDRPVFLTGKAGTGKTTLLRYIVEHTHKNCVIVAPTGIAAINAGGTTIHSMFQLPFGTFLPTDVIDLSKEDFLELHTPTQLLKKSKLNTRKRRLLQQIELLVIDEVSMLRADVLDAIDLVMRFVRRNKHAFGGAQVLFIGDMLQLPPVVKDKEWNLLRRFYKSMYFFDAHVLQQYKPQTIELNKIYRQSDAEFIAVLNHFRENKISDSDFNLLNRYYKKDFLPKPSEHYIWLTTHNRKADTINQSKLQAIGLNDYSYSASVQNDFPESLYPVDITLTLKVGAQVMFLKNDYSGMQKYFNGKIGQVCALTDTVIEILCGENEDVIEVERYTWENKRYVLNQKTNDIEEHVIGTFTHFPLRLAWAVTIHKSQGLTFERAIIDVSEAFAPGQMYVALSRLQSLQGLVLSAPLEDGGPQQDNRLLSFAAQKADETVLETELKSATNEYVFNFIVQTFDYSELRQEIDDLILSYNKEENRSQKQKFLPWAEQLKLSFSEVDEVARKFRSQIIGIANRDSNNLQYLLERLQASKPFFMPKLFSCTQSIFTHINAIESFAGVKEYVVELRAVESMFFDRIKRIKKSIVILESILKEKELKRGLLNVDDIVHERMELQHVQKVQGEKKLKRLKKQDTKERTLEMYHAGNDIDTIAKLRDLARKTVENHLAYFISDGILAATEFVSFEKLDVIEQTIQTQNTKSIKAILDALPTGFYEWEIKFALAGMESK